MAASREEIAERVKDVLVEQLGIEESELTEEASFQEDLDADSLDLVELIMELEEQFGIKISDEDAQQIQTVGQAVDYISSHQWSGAGRLPSRPDPGASGRAPQPRFYARLVGAQPGGFLRAPRVPRGQRA